MFCFAIFSSCVIGAVTFLVYKVVKFFRIPPVPKLEEKWWGTGYPSEEDTSIQPFEIHVKDEELADLKSRLENAVPLQEPIEDSKQHYGTNTKLLKTVLDFWKTDYNWKEREKFFNQYPQYKTSIQGLKIHYVHVKPSNKENLKVYPILLLSGFPGSVREFYEVIPLLTNPHGTDFVFEVIVPSLPGFGFSDATNKKGMEPLQMAIIFKNLMKRLGFKKYYIQGGNWGALIVQLMSVLFPENILGMHCSLCTTNTPIALIKSGLWLYLPFLILNEEEKRHPEMSLRGLLDFWFGKEDGYFRIQSTKPSTIGTALRDTPVGLAAYILEKFTTWTNRNYRDFEDGGLTLKFDYTKLLDNIMTFWITKSISSAVRIYYEYEHKPQASAELEKIPIEIPSGCTRFLKAIVVQPESVLREQMPNLVYTSIRDVGDFGAFEGPDMFAEDVFKFVQAVEKSGRP